MWNSPNGETQYSIEDIAVLTYPLDIILDLLNDSQVSDIASEPFLHSLSNEEFIFAMYQVFQALTERTPIPKEGHPGYQEAIVSELMTQTFSQIVLELKAQDCGSSAREAAWLSFIRLAPKTEIPGFLNPLEIEGIDLDFNDPEAYRSKLLTADIWENQILGSNALLWNNFLWDEDWRNYAIMDAPNPEADVLSQIMSLDIDTVHALPPTPKNTEYQFAQNYLKDIIWQDEQRFNTET